MISFRKETNKISPIIIMGFLLEELSRPQCGKRKLKQRK
jgi:hypothetical protein